uniref:Uncharacterized protein n=1 Tax=Romanomermis culicivorax TaxID=13658 RepID=A0A915J968_ROMCU
MNHCFLPLFFCEKNCPLFKGGKVCSSNTQCCERQRCDQETGFCRWIEIGEKLNSDKVCAKDFNCPSEYVCIKKRCVFKGPKYAHMFPIGEITGKCSSNDNCPAEFYCKLDRETCYRA